MRHNDSLIQGRPWLKSRFVPVALEPSREGTKGRLDPYETTVIRIGRNSDSSSIHFDRQGSRATG